MGSAILDEKEENKNNVIKEYKMNVVYNDSFIEGY